MLHIHIVLEIDIYLLRQFFSKHPERNSTHVMGPPFDDLSKIFKNGL